MVLNSGNRFVQIIKSVLVWRVFTLLFAIPGIFLLPIRPGYTQLSPGLSWQNFLSMWASFDGYHYLNLAKFGYGSPFTHMNYAFFPVYPWTINTLNVFGSYLVSGLFVSHLAFILALYFLYKLLLLDCSSKVADLALFLLLIFPTSFFFGSVYSESLFLLLSVLSFYLLRTRHFFLACFVAMIASATRVTGIFLWPALVYEFWIIYGRDFKRALNPDLLWFILPPMGLYSYMKFQMIKTNDFLFFVHSQPLFGAQRAVDKLVLLHQVFYRYAKMIIFVDHANPLFFTVLLETIVGLGLLVLLIYGIKKLRFSYLIYLIPSYLLPSLSGTFSSLPRYVLVLFPAFALLAEILHKASPKYRYTYIFLSLVFSFLAITFFTRGYFVG